MLALAERGHWFAWSSGVHFWQASENTQLSCSSGSRPFLCLLQWPVTARFKNLNVLSVPQLTSKSWFLVCHCMPTVLQEPGHFLDIIFSCPFALKALYFVIKKHLFSGGKSETGF